MMENITIRFHNTLNDLLPAVQRDTVIEYELKQTRSVKDLVESIGIPHTEIDLVIINGNSAGFNYLLKGGEQVHMYPLLNAGEISLLKVAPLIHCLPLPLNTARFVLDVHLGKLAAYLRMLGFDTLYKNNCEDLTLARLSADEDRILLTCDRQLLMRKQVSRGYFVRTRQPNQQLREVLLRFDLYRRLQPFTRCMHCNGETEQVDKADIESRLLPKTKKYYNEFYQCRICKKVYWKGSHYRRMKSMIEEIQQKQLNAV